MELIPILSTIILVATIATFLLAIGAYILYKVRERKGAERTETAPATVEAEMVTPAEAPAREREEERTRIKPEPVYAEPRRGSAGPEIQRQPIYINQEAGPSPQTGYSTGRQYSGQRGYQRDNYVPETSYSPETREEKKYDSKFLKYTSEGYVPAKEDKQSGALKWR